MAIDPQIQDLLDGIRAAGFPKIGTVTAAELRARRASPPEVTIALEAVDDITIPGTGTAIPVRIYRPAQSTAGLIVYLHGGGWVLGDLDTFDPMVRAMTEKTGCTVVSVDYRLAPEHRFPAAVDDAIAALSWAASERQALVGQADAPIVIMGDSAGGNLAAVCAQQARDRGALPIILQVLIYPSVAGDHQPKPDTANEPPFLTSSEITWFVDQYVPAEQRADPRFVPASAADLSGLPPTIIVVAEHDLLTAEGLLYGDRLRAAGVEVTVLDYPGTIHGFLTMATNLGIGRRAIAEIAQQISRRLA